MLYKGDNLSQYCSVLTRMLRGSLLDSLVTTEQYFVSLFIHMLRKLNNHIIKYMSINRKLENKLCF